MIVDVTTVSDCEVTAHVTPDEGPVRTVHRDGLDPDSEVSVEIDGGDSDVTVRTLPRPSGRLNCVFTTVNDVHFGEVEAGRIGDRTDGPIRRVDRDDSPYPEVMNQGAVDEMAAVDPVAVIVKGDLSVDGEPHEWEAFERCYRDPFGDRLHVVRGNHDAYRHQDRYAGDRRIDLPGITVALIDTVIPGATTGHLTADQIDWLDDLAASATAPVIAMGHHQQWIADPDDPKRSDDYFGLDPDASDRLDEVCSRRTAIIAYASGHTHRHRVRHMGASGVPSIEIGCTKDFPGTWAEYRVFDGAVMQVVHRVSTPEALAWSESCRGLYADFGLDYGAYALGDLSDRCVVIPLR